MGNYRDYGYATSGFRHAHSYLVSPVEEMLDNKKNRKILDVGCGNGAIANFLIDRGFDVFGTDASESGIRIANEMNEGRFFIQDLESDEVPFQIQSLNFDTIISTEVVEHLYAPRKYISFCKNVLLKNGGGEIIISTPYHGYWKNLIMAVFGKWDKHLTVLWDGGHIKFWSKETLSKLLEEQGFEVVAFKGVGRIPFVWKSMIIKARL
ncbi:bifunctional 2-polyprenyl-6-hydroxyphenol methylase/3-demethylubiquinol 3-O-methyltransferase UbiG [Persicobacter sp. CCB-QB2]|uniref:class I SAM-dependent methyltransferase n=1 Tax=Persicobacter sp. CCB-QB2 TaxID=1561025 RepID=UPI0006A94AE9|nr:class I SAM-dependent methyltransferase [Persicobacter sp. CCB-QB2]